MLVLVQKLTIIAEGVLKDALIQDLLSFGAHGYTWHEAHGHGSRGIQQNVWFGPQIELVTLVSPEKAEALLEHLAKTYFADYAVIAYLEEVRVLRGDKFL